MRGGSALYLFCRISLAVGGVPSPRPLPREGRGRGVKGAAALLAVVAFATSPHAQDRAPSQRQSLIDLAYVLGESHALRQVCAGPDDQYWRDRMQDLVRAETPDADLDRRLKSAFNTGFVAGQSAFPICGRASRREEARQAAKGKALASSLTRPMANAPPAR